MKAVYPYFLVGACLAGLLGFSARTRAALATGVSGFYYTGESAALTTIAYAGTPTTNNSGTQDPYWNVTYASTNGGSSEALQYVSSAYGGSAGNGSSYIINTSSNPGSGLGSEFPSPPWAPNTSNAEWITAPGAYYVTSGSGSGTTGGVNAGGDSLPGTTTNGTGYTDVYVYTTTFTISGTGTGQAVTGFTMNLSVSADNAFAIFVNPSTSKAYLATGTAAFNSVSSLANAYTAATTIALTSGFKIGVNTISIEVSNADQGGAANYSGLLVYGTNFTGIPEVGTWLPVIGAVMLYGAWLVARRSRSVFQLSCA